MHPYSENLDDRMSPDSVTPQSTVASQSKLSDTPDFSAMLDPNLGQTLLSFKIQLVEKKEHPSYLEGCLSICEKT